MEKLKKIFLPVKNKNFPAALKAFILQLIFFLAGLLFSSISFADGISPFAAGFIAGIPTHFMLTSAIGAGIGYIIFLGMFDSLRFVSMALLICIISLGGRDRASEKYKQLFIAITSFLSCFLSSLAVFIAIGGENTYIILSLCESVIASAFAVFTLRIADIVSARKKTVFFTTADTVAVVFFLSVILMALGSISVRGFSPADCIVYFMILLFALSGKTTIPLMTGICAALTLGFGTERSELMPSFILTGLFSAVAGNYGKLPVAISLVISSALSIVLKGSSETAILSISEAALSGTVFMLIPEKLLFALINKLIPAGDFMHEEKSKALHFSLRQSAKAVKDISSSVSAVSALLQKTEKPSTADLPGLIREDICKECNKYDFCWNKCRDMTAASFEKACQVLIEKGRLTSENMPERPALICRMPDKLCDSFNKAYCEHNARLVAREEITEAKKAAARQFYSLGLILEDAADTLCRPQRPEPALSSSAFSVLKELGFSLTEVNAFINSSGKSTVRAYCSHIPNMPDKDILRERLLASTGKYFLPPVADEYTEEGTVISLTEECRFTAEYHTAKQKGPGEEFSGDSCECFFDGNGFFYAVLSDGMGSGARAAIDSVMTSSLMSRLMRSGFSPDCALEAVNCALMIKSADESLSTLDIIKINLETGMTQIYKAGAAATVIRKAEKTIAVEKSSLPIGILREAGFEKSELKLSENDIICLMSDGASVIPLPCFKELLRDSKSNGVITLAENAVSKAIEMSPSGRHDDITVTCIKLVRT